MDNLNINASTEIFQNYAEECSITLIGNGNDKGVKFKWYTQILDSMPLQDATKLDVLIGFTAYFQRLNSGKAFLLKNASANNLMIKAFLIDRLNISEWRLACLLSQLMHDDDYIRFNDDGNLRLTKSAQDYIASQNYKNQIMVCVVDDWVINVLSYEVYVRHNKLHQSYKPERYLVWVNVSFFPELVITYEYAESEYDSDEIGQTICSNNDVRIQEALNHWLRYNKIMADSFDLG